MVAHFRKCPLCQPLKLNNSNNLVFHRLSNFYPLERFEQQTASLNKVVSMIQKYPCLAWFYENLSQWLIYFRCNACSNSENNNKKAQMRTKLQTNILKKLTNTF